MARPDWCPYPECQWVTGGPEGDMTGSGVACGGRLDAPRNHLGTPNTHRLCLITAEGTRDLTTLELNSTDLWYFGRIIRALTEDTRKVTRPPSPRRNG